MMEDFNTMCADIEAGLVHAEGASSSAVSAAEKTAADALAGLQKGLYRAAYNHYWLLADAELSPSQSGMFRQVLSGSSRPTGVSGLTVMGDYCLAARYSGEMTAAALQVTELSALYVSKESLEKCKALVFEFTSPGAGRTTKCTVDGSYQGGPGQCTLQAEIENLTSGEREVLAETAIKPSGTSGIGAQTFDLRFNLRVGQRYRVTLTPTNTPFLATYHFQRLTVSGITGAESGSVQREFHDEEPRLGGLLLVRYTEAGSGGTLSASWGGYTAAPALTRSVTDNQGRSLREAEFHIPAPIPAESTVRLDVAANPEGDIALYEWGGVLI